MSVSTLNNTGVLLNNSLYVDMPVGIIIIWLSTSLPTDNTYLWCDGSIYSPTDYPDLYTVLENSYGGTTTQPRLPNLLNRAPIGGIVKGNIIDISLGSTEPTAVYNTTFLKTGGNSELDPSQFIHKHNVSGGPFISDVTSTKNTDNDSGGSNQNYYNNQSFNNGLTFGETSSSTHYPPHNKVNYIIFAGKKTNAISSKY
jgi:microcystin-dependent protein